MRKFFIKLGHFSRGLVFVHDLAWVPLSILLAFWMRFNVGLIPADQLHSVIELITIAIPVQAGLFLFFGCHRGIWLFVSIPDLLRLLKAVALGSALVLVAMVLFYRLGNIPRTVVVLYPIFLFLGASSTRVMYRLFKTHSITLENQERSTALIVGAGRAGDMLVRDLLERGPFVPVAIVDDNRKRKGTSLHGVPIVGRISALRESIKEYSVETVLIAMPSAPMQVMDEVVKVCTQMHIPCRTLPSLAELADGRVEVSRLRPVTVDDLLGRKPVTLDEKAICAYIAGKCVAVTGGGGSIGSELCRQVLQHDPDTLLIIDSSEYNLYQIGLELEEDFPGLSIIAVLADIRIQATVEKVFAAYKPEVVFHAAAYKHVPILEDNIVEGARNNVVGTKIVADAAVKYGVHKFVQVSTDKTVNPQSLMGATKRVAEVYCQALNAHSDTEFVTTRFGNVLGSAGSVVPLFEKQIQKGGPVTVTHPDVTRYFMTIPEAAALILQAGSMGQGGEIYVLDMGEPIKIADLAENMIRLCGFEPGRDIEIEFIGLRPGEKLQEELFYKKEELRGTGHAKLMLANCVALGFDDLLARLQELEAAIKLADTTAVVQSVQEIVPEFNRSKVSNKAEVVRLKPKRGRA